MTTIVQNFIDVSLNTDLNFWDVNPLFKTISVFKEFYTKDKSAKKKDSSKVMWAIALLIDPNDGNPWKNYSEDSKKLLIKTEFLEDEDFDFEDYKELLEEYENRCLTIAEKELVRFERKIVGRGNFIAKTKYTLDEFNEDTGKLIKGTADQLDKVMLNTTKINEQYNIIKDFHH